MRPLHWHETLLVFLCGATITGMLSILVFDALGLIHVKPEPEYGEWHEVHKLCRSVQLGGLEPRDECVPLSRRSR